MLTFGFSVVKFFQFLRQQGVNRHADQQPRELGLLIMATGFLALASGHLALRRLPCFSWATPLRLFNSPTLIVTAVLLMIQALALFWALTGR